MRKLLVMMIIVALGSMQGATFAAPLSVHDNHASMQTLDAPHAMHQQTPAKTAAATAENHACCDKDTSCQCNTGSRCHVAQIFDTSAVNTEIFGLKQGHEQRRFKLADSGYIYGFAPPPKA
ncbi:hypothetical protein [Kordiimonas pumila]|uniref:Uncharacterized protein n=1 Tax=Kordiimonas pumila TaxID=2161677 RepID=A0ABV7D179_9PROT|nr:hypothetical protein [Kordiimonas pumila]